ncbi:MAG: hypothetical protein KA221_04785 [Vitreoscilla sp.]|nr:hypothetical protein [Vitreoscilla sp.]MBP9541644.1 hypothetical protein [Vitreoscilla sp.]
MKIIPMVLCASMALSACTSMLWKGTPVNTTITKSQNIGEDELTAWAQSGRAPQAKLAIVGKQAAYVLEQGQDDVQWLLSLPQAGTHLQVSPLKGEQALSITLDTNEAAPQFSGSAVFTYRVTQPSDEVYYALQSRKGQKLASFEVKGKEVVYSERVDFGGKLYQTPPQWLTRSNQFTQTHKIVWQQLERKPSVQGGNILKRVVLTPFTLLGDAVILPLML